MVTSEEKRPYKKAPKKKHPDIISHTEYAKALREIIYYNSLTQKQLITMNDYQRQRWEEKATKAFVIKRQYETLKRLDII